MYLTMAKEEMAVPIKEIQAKLKWIVNRHEYKGNIREIEKEFLLSKVTIFKILQFYIIWKILKDLLVGRLTVIGHYEK